MAGAMKPAVAVFASLLLGSLPSAASLAPEDWQSTLLPNAGGTNQWFFFPDGEQNPRIIAKAIANAGSVNRVTLTGGPNLWTGAPAVSEPGLNKEGVFVPTGSETGFLVGPHFTSPSYRLRMWSFTANGSVGDEVIDNVVNNVGMGGVSAMIDPAGTLHAAWIWSPGANESLVYGRRNASGQWQIDEQVFNRTNNLDNGIRIGDTAVVPSAFGAANIYFTLNTPVSGTTNTSLMKMNTLINAAGLFLENPTVLVTSGVKNTLRGTRVGSADRVFYFEGTALRRWSGAGAIDVETSLGANFAPRSIHIAASPVDGRQRVAWYDANTTTKKIHYLKPNVADLSYTAYTPVTVTGGGADTDLHGLHFDSSGTPYILYRKLAAEGYVAYPNDNFDFNGNGRVDIIDNAFGSTKLGVTTLPVIPPASGLPTSGNKFKIQFPTVGSATSNGQGAVITSVASNESLKYELEVSTDGIAWTKITSGAPISYSFVKTGGSGNNETRTCTGVFSDPAPGSVPKRFARVIVTRTPYPY